MPLKLVTADQRLAEANGKTTIAIFGPAGVGKTSLAASTLPAAETLCVDLEAGHEVGPGLAPATASRSAASPDAVDIACLIGGVDPAADPQRVLLRGPPPPCQPRPTPTWSELIAGKRIVFVDSITDLTRQAMAWAKTRPEAFSEKTGKPDIRGAFGLLAREVIALLKHLQHAPGRTVIFVGVLERVVDEFNREHWQPQMEGGKAGRELPGIVDQVMTS